MAGLGAYLAEKRISREMLNLPVNPESRNQIALKIGKNWECLATCIGISSQEVFDLKEMYPNSPQDQRLGMMNRWEELYGSEATYLKLIEGLEQTGRRDLTELLIRVVMSRPAFSKARDEEGRLNVASILNTDGVPASTHNPSTDKPGYLPLRRDPISHISMPSHYDDFGMHMGTPSGPHSEPAKKHVERPLFSSSLPGLENAVVRRAAFTPVSDRISSEAMGHNEIKMFRNHYSGTQLTLSPNTYGNPYSTTSSTVLPSSHRTYGISQPNQPYNSHKIDALVDGLANLSLPRSETPNAKHKEPARRGRSSLPSTDCITGNLGGGTSIPTDLNHAGGVPRTKSEPQHVSDHSSSQDGGARGRESVKSSLPQELSVGLCLDQLSDMNSSPDSGIQFATTAPTPSQPTVPLPNPQTSPSQEGDGKSGIRESQDAVGSDYLSCGHLRCPSLQSSSSVDSSGSPFPLPEINPIQVSEKSPSEYHPLAESKRPIRQRCRKCAKLKQESNTLKEKLHEVQSEWNTERQQNTEQIKGLREELHRQRLDNYELKQRVYGSEVRHREATKTIQKLQMELGNMTQLFRLQQTEQAKLKEAYDCSFMAKCELLKVQLQRADSLQCPEEAGYYDINTAEMSHHGQYSMNSGPNVSSSGYHERTVANTEWQNANFQPVHPGNHNIHPHAMLQ